MKSLFAAIIAALALSANVNAAQKFECDMSFGGMTPVTVTATTLTIDDFQAVRAGLVYSRNENGDLVTGENFEYKGTKYNLFFRLTATTLAVPEDATPEVKAEIERKNKEERYSLSVFESAVFWKDKKRVDIDGKPLTEQQIKMSSHEFIPHQCKKVSL